MTKKIKKLKIKISTILFISIFTVININAMNSAPEPFYETKGRNELNDRPLRKFIKLIENYVKKIDEEISTVGVITYNNYDIKNSIDNFNLINQIAERQLKIINSLESNENQIINLDETIIKKEIFENILDILKNIKIKNNKENLDEKNLDEKDLNEYNIFDEKNNSNYIDGFRIFKDNKEYLTNFFDKLKKFATDNQNLFQLMLEKYKNNKSERSTITTEMVKKYENFLKKEIKKQNNISYKDFYNITGCDINNDEIEDNVLISNVIFFGNVDENGKNKISKEKAENIVKDCSFYIDKSLKNDLMNFVKNIKKQIIINNNINDNKDVADQITITDDKGTTYKIDIKKAFNTFLISKLNGHKDALQKAQKAVEENQVDISGAIGYFLSNNQEIFDHLFLNFENKLNKNRLGYFLCEKVTKENNIKIKHVDIQYDERTLQSFEDQLKYFKKNVENLSKLFEKTIIKHLVNNKTTINKNYDNILECYEKISMMRSDIFLRKFWSYYDSTEETEKIEKFKSNNLEQLKEEYKEILNLLCLKNENTINEEQLLENLKKLNMIDKNIKTIEIDKELKQKINKKLNINKKIIKEGMNKKFNSFFADAEKYRNIFDSVEQEYVKQLNSAPPLLEQKKDIDSLMKDYNYDVPMKKEERDENIKEIRKNLEEVAEKIKNTDENKTPLLNLDDEELEIFNNLVDKIKISLLMKNRNDNKEEQNNKIKNKKNENNKKNKNNKKNNKKK